MFSTQNGDVMCAQDQFKFLFSTQNQTTLDEYTMLSWGRGGVVLRLSK